jgi:hypothetical protein
VSDRPDLAVMWNLAFDDQKMPTRRKEKLRLRLGLDGRAVVWPVAEVRCPRRNHLQAYVFGTTFGAWAAYRSIVGGRDVWGQVWLDELTGPVEVTCHCDGRRLVDFDAIPPRNRR